MGKFSMNEAEKGSYNREKFLPGLHEVVITDVKYESGFKGTFFKLYMKVLSGPTAAGSERVWLINPDDAKGGKGISPSKARARDIYKIKEVLAFAYGMTEGQTDSVTDEVFEASLTKADRHTPLAGRKLIVKAVPGNKEGSVWLNFALHPDMAGVPVGTPVAAAAVTPPAPPVPASFPPAGWLPHPSAPGYYYSGTEVLTEAQLRAKV